VLAADLLNHAAKMGASIADVQTMLRRCGFSTPNQV
jgi:hypothetical protein